MKYINLSVKEGRESFPKIWNLFFKPLANGDFFVEPWSNRALRDCAEFRLDQSGEIFFFVDNEKLASFLKETTGKLYLFGAYNQINVCQMRASGTVTFETGHPETEQIRKRLYKAIESRTRVNINRLDEEEAEVRYSILKKGLLFCFHINSYGYNTYERG